MSDIRIYTKQGLIDAIAVIRDRGWIRNESRQGNAGAIGNMLEDLLGIAENNLPIPNAAEWELKVARKKANPLTTLRHLEPSPRAISFVPSLFLPLYGWGHSLAGVKYPLSEMSFRQTMNAKSPTDRGFRINVNDVEKRIEVSFDASVVNARHTEWLTNVEARVGLGELAPQPYWGFQDLNHAIGTKLNNLFYVIGQKKMIEGEEHFRYDNLMILKGFSFLQFLELMRQGDILVDIDARTGHNHGTKFRIRQGRIALLYAEADPIF